MPVSSRIGFVSLVAFLPGSNEIVAENLKQVVASLKTVFGRAIAPVSCRDVCRVGILGFARPTDRHAVLLYTPVILGSITLALTQSI